MPTIVTLSANPARNIPARYKAVIRKAGWKTVARTFDRLQDARRWATEAEAAMIRGAFVDGREAGRTSLAACLERYLAEVTPRKKGARQETTLIRRWLRDSLVHRPLPAVRAPDIARWRDAQVAAGKAPSTISNALGIISQVYKLARTDWGMEGAENPCRDVRKPTARLGRDVVLAVDQETRLLEACAGLGLYILREFIVLAVESAMRRSEMLALRWQDVRGNVARLRTSKNGQGRAVPLSPRALEALAALPRVTVQVFPISPHTLDKQWRRACSEAGVAGVRVHDLRHTAVTRLLERGLEPFEAMAVSGHRDPRMLQRYTHLSAAKIAAKLAA